MSESREADAQRFQSESVTCALRWVLSCERTATGVRSGEDRTKSRRREKERHTECDRDRCGGDVRPTGAPACPRKSAQDRAGAGGAGGAARAGR